MTQYPSFTFIQNSPFFLHFFFPQTNYFIRNVVCFSVQHVQSFFSLPGFISPLFTPKIYIVSFVYNILLCLSQLILSPTIQLISSPIYHHFIFSFLFWSWSPFFLHHNYTSPSPSHFSFLSPPSHYHTKLKYNVVELQTNVIIIHYLFF